MKTEKHEKQLRSDFEYIQSMAKNASVRLSQLANFVKSYQTPENFAKRGLDLAVSKIESDQIDSVDSIVRTLKRVVNKYRTHRDAYLQEHPEQFDVFLADGHLSKGRWKEIGEDYPNSIELNREPK